MSKLLSYYLQRIRYPKFYDYIDMGLGIEARFVRCKKYWKKHIQYSKDFQRGSFERLKNRESVAILGAGRLFDVDLESLRTHFKRIEFFDADPGIRRSWKRFSSSLAPTQIFVDHITDITGDICKWTDALTSFLRAHSPSKKDELINFLFNLSPSKNLLQGYSCIVSLNLLSQIPIYWRDRVHNLLQKHWKLETDNQGRYIDKLQLALEATFVKLQEQHVAMLQNSSAEIILIISDTDFFYYADDNAAWVCEDAIYLGEDLKLANYAVMRTDSWLWHIAPQHIEQRGYGVINRVGAWEFQKIK